MNESEKSFGRRTMLRRALVVLAASPVLGASLSACGSGGGLSCSTDGLGPAQLAVRGGLHYVEHGTDAARQCSGCQLYTGNATACGTCASVPGSINPQGTCDAFAARA